MMVISCPLVTGSTRFLCGQLAITSMGMFLDMADMFAPLEQVRLAQHGRAREDVKDQMEITRRSGEKKPKKRRRRDRNTHTVDCVKG